jgi:hypothetical protein
MYELESQVEESTKHFSSKCIKIDSVESNDLCLTLDNEVDIEEFFIEDNKNLTDEVCNGGQLIEIKVAMDSHQYKEKQVLRFGDIDVNKGFKILALAKRNPFKPACTIFYVQKELALICRPVFNQIKNLNSSKFIMTIRPLLRLSSTMKELEAILNLDGNALTEIFVNP